jgi:C4-dicarboxylate-specific signal transduction histidine kinase
VPSGARTLWVSTAKTEDGNVVAAIADTGPGLSGEGHARLFEPFFTTKQSGLGIGLSICRAIVEAHGGILAAEADAQRGAVLRFSLPCLNLAEAHRD